MSLLTALYSGATGLEANSTELSVVGDNIANANTIGFKAARADFADQMAETLIGTGGNNGQRGLGTRVQMIQKLLTQGAINSTGISTDLAIQGGGFFVVSGNSGGQQGTYYTRSGQFNVDKDGFMTNMDGLRVQGYTADDSGLVNAAALGDLKVGNAAALPKATTQVTVRANLDADAVPPAPFDAANAATTSNFSTSMTVFDSLGKGHQVDVFFRKNGAGDWEWHALSDGGGLAGGAPGTPTEVAGGTASFDSSGRLTATTGTSNFNPNGATNPQPLTFNFGTPFPTGTGADGLTQFSGTSSASFLNQDGYASGDLARISVDSKGEIVGAFTNGQNRVLGQVALASFTAPDQLMRTGSNLYASVPSAGSPNVGQPSTAARGAIVAGALEQSNVDLASEFIRMIAAQRGFQANSKTLTTADSLLAELMTIKR
jgi:flagellar hook protein FlgE